MTKTFFAALTTENGLAVRNAHILLERYVSEVVIHHHHYGFDIATSSSLLNTTLTVPARVAPFDSHVCHWVPTWLKAVDLNVLKCYSIETRHLSE